MLGEASVVLLPEGVRPMEATLGIPGERGEGAALETPGRGEGAGLLPVPLAAPLSERGVPAGQGMRGRESSRAADMQVGLCWNWSRSDPAGPLPAG